MKAVLVSLIILFLYVVPGHAGFVDDWLITSQTTNPDYFEGQKRGYATGGSFSARMPLNTDYLFTVTSPKLKTGCGGIDAYLGGISFMNFDYLVQKFQRILSAAPAAAFDIALKTLCEPCANTVKEMEGIANALNSLSLDDCKASRAMAAYLMDPLAPDGTKKQSDLDAITKDFMVSSGIDDFPRRIGDAIKAAGDNPPPNMDYRNAVAGCPTDIRDLFGSTGSVLDRIGGKLALDQSYINLIRGIVGDIIMRVEEKEFSPRYETFCDKNKIFSVDAFLDGGAEEKSYNPATDTCACVQIPDVNRSLRTYVRLRLMTTINAMKTKTPLAPTETDFIRFCPIPVSLALKSAVATHTEGAILENLTELTAKAYALRIIEDLLGKAEFAFFKATEALSKQSNATLNQGEHTCKINALDLGSQIKPLRERVHEVRQSLQLSYSATQNEFSAIMDMARKIEDFDAKAKKDIAARFGKALSERMFK